MIKSTTLLHSFTKMLHEGVKDIAITTETEEVNNNKECFYVDLVPTRNATNSIYINDRAFTVEIIYKPEDFSGKTQMYDMIDTLNNIFSRTVEVEDRSLKIKEVRERILKDAMGYYLSYSIDFEFFDIINYELEEYELMEHIDTTITDEMEVE